MSQSKTEWCWSSDDLSGVVILRSMARAHILVGSPVPWNNAAQMGTDCINSVGFNTGFSGNQVMSISLESLNELPVT